MIIDEHIQFGQECFQFFGHALILETLRLLLLRDTLQGINHLAGLAERVLRTHDPELAAEIGRRDDELDDLHRRRLTQIQDPSWLGSIPAAVDITLLGRFYERFGDHTVVVGRRVIFLVTGEQLNP